MGLDTDGNRKDKLVAYILMDIVTSGFGFIVLEGTRTLVCMAAFPANSACVVADQGIMDTIFGANMLLDGYITVAIGSALTTIYAIVNKGKRN